MAFKNDPTVAAYESFPRAWARENRLETHDLGLPRPRGGKWGRRRPEGREGVAEMQRIPRYSILRLCGWLNEGLVPAARSTI